MNYAMILVLQMSEWDVEIICLNVYMMEPQTEKYTYV